MPNTREVLREEPKGTDHHEDLSHAKLGDEPCRIGDRSGDSAGVLTSNDCIMVKGTGGGPRVDLGGLPTEGTSHVSTPHRGLPPAPVVPRRRPAPRYVRPDPSKSATTHSQGRVRGRSLAGLVDQFLLETYPKPSTQRYHREIRRLFHVHIIPTWGPSFDIHRVCKQELKGFVHHFDDFPSLKMNLYRALSVFFKWLVYEDVLTVNPLLGVRVPKKVNPRERTLDLGEVSQLLRVLDSHKSPRVRCFYLSLLLTCQRRTEVSEASLQELSEGLWEIPSYRSKNRRSHLVPLPPKAWEALQGYLAHPPRIVGFSKVHADIVHLTGLPHFTIHDLRRTGATLMASKGVRPEVIERVLNHTPGKLVGTYQKYQYLQEKREALQVLENTLSSLGPLQGRARVPSRGGHGSPPREGQGSPPEPLGAPVSSFGYHPSQDPQDRRVRSTSGFLGAFQGESSPYWEFLLEKFRV